MRGNGASRPRRVGDFLHNRTGELQGALAAMGGLPFFVWYFPDHKVIVARLHSSRAGRRAVNVVKMIGSVSAAVYEAWIYVVCENREVLVVNVGFQTKSLHLFLQRLTFQFDPRGGGRRRPSRDRHSIGGLR